MSDAPTVPIGSLRASPSVPTEGHEAAVVDLVEAGSVVWWKDGGVNYFPQGEAFTVERSCRVEPLVTRQSALEAIDAATQQATGEGLTIHPASWTGTVADYIMRYGGACRECADHDGTCPKGLPCDPDAARRAIAQVLNAVSYGVKHGYLSTQQAVSPPEGVWRPIETAPRDRRWIVALVANATDRWEHLNGRAFVIRREGGTGDGYDLSWSLYPGVGGVPDHWLSCWTPLPPAPGAEETVECEPCGGAGKITEDARLHGPNQHSACQRDCDECDGTGYQVAPDAIGEEKGAGE